MEAFRPLLLGAMLAGVLGAFACEGTATAPSDETTDASADASSTDGAATADGTTDASDDAAAEKEASSTDAGSGDADAARFDASDASDAALADGGTCPTQPCDLHEQCGCSGGDVCDLNYATFSGTSCRAVTTAGTENSPCSAPTACAGGYGCINGTCKRYCTAHTDCTQPRGQCVSAVFDSGVVSCSPNCDPLDTAGGGCAATKKCVLAYAASPPLPGDTPRYFVDCNAAGSGTQGAACASAGQPDDALCAAGYFCAQITAGDTGHCRRICQVGKSTGCPSSTSCSSFAAPAVVAGVEYGLCL